MTTNTLTKLYDRLTVAERGPLMLAAIARGDDVEQRRLVDAAVWKHRRVTDTYGWVISASLVAGEYHERQWELLAYLLFAKFQVAEQAEAGDNVEWLLFIHDVAAYRFIVNETAWGMFCDELRIDPDSHRVDDVLFDLAQENVSRDAPSADELLKRYPNRFPSHDDGTPFKPVTPTAVADEWRDLFRQLAGQWE